MEEHNRKHLRELAEQAIRGEKHAIAKLITLIEESLDNFEPIADIIWPRTLRAHVIGVTGMPGAGKSTLISRLVKLLRREDKRIGIIAIDPSSPLSGGSLLGDRIRMQRYLDERVFMRSMPARREGVLPWRALLALEILDAVGYDYVIIETVGAGQSDVQIMNVADTVIVTIIPGAGDEIQMLKAGLMEIGDIYVVNKADRPEAETTFNQVKFALENIVREGGWKPPIHMTAAVMNRGVKELLETIKKHYSFLKEKNILAKRREKRRLLELDMFLKARFEEAVRRTLASKSELIDIVEDVKSHRIDPVVASKKILCEIASCFYEARS